MVDVNTNADVKSFGLPVVPSVTVEERSKPQVEPVKETTDSGSSALDDKALHGQGVQKKESLSSEEIARVVEEIQAKLDSLGGNLSLGLNQANGTDNIVVQVKEKNTGELVRQVPSEDLLALKKKIEDVVGILFEQTA